MDREKVLQIITDMKKLEQCTDTELAMIASYMQGVIGCRDIEHNKAS